MRYKLPQGLLFLCTALDMMATIVDVEVCAMKIYTYIFHKKKMFVEWKKRGSKIG